MPNSLEKYKIRGTTIRVRRLGHHRIELITSDRKKDLQVGIFKKVRGTSYADQTEHNKFGNIICRLLPKGKLSFNQLIQKIVNLVVSKIERYDKKMANSSQSSSQPRKKRRGAKGYKNKALATT